MNQTDERPRDPGQDRLLEHDADGIREYDNPMPRWWVWIFWITIGWAALYGANVIPGVGTGRGRVANYEADMAAAGAKYGALRAAAERAAPAVTDEAIRALAGDAAAMARAKETFATNCVACHLEDGGGSIGPNLTDDFWIHGPQPLDIHRTIAAGVLDKGMPAWSEVLGPEEVTALAAYVTTLHGTSPKTAKEPQGARFEYEHGRPRAAEGHDHGTHGAAETEKK
jgi:cytochrome c oxidase cbb3-type subunit 3